VTPPVPPDEPARLDALRRYHVLDTPPEPAFDDVVRLAATLCDAPVALVSLVDAGRTWFKAAVGLAEMGLTAGELPRSASFCAHALQGEPLIVPDATRDERFRGLDLVTGPAGVRFYAGVPLRTCQGHVIGTVCVLDLTPRALAPGHLTGLEALARQTMTALEHRAAVRERDAMQHALERERAFLRRIIDTQPSMVFVKDWVGRFVLVNQSLARCYGTTVDGIVGKTDADLNPDAAEVSHFVEDDRQVMRTRRMLVIPEEPVTGADGEVLWFSTVKVPLVDEDGSCLQLLGIATDITEQRRVAAALRESERLHRTLGDMAPGFVWTVGPDGRVEYVNRTWEEFTGSSRGQLNRGGWQRYNHPDEVPEIERRWRAAMEAGAPFEMELRYRRRDGIYRWMLSRVVPVRDEAGRVSRWVGSAVDIEDMKQSEERLRQAERLEAVGRLAGGVAHDLNNMLVTILGYSDMVAQSLEPGDARREDVEAITVAAGRSAALTRQLLAFARRDLIQPRRFDLNTLIRAGRRMLEVALGEAAALDLDLADGELVAFADPSRIEQVLLNLVLNARDAMPGGGRVGITTGRATLDPAYLDGHQGSEARPGPYVLLVVSDTGHGMSAETLAQVFEPFFTTKPFGRGTGLGLSMAYGTVTQAGGVIWPYSEPGQGSVFKVYLPAVTGAPEPGQDPARGPAMGHGRVILVVDDAESIRTVTCRALEERGYRCLAAAGAVPALALLAADPSVDLVVTDVVMPEVSGRALADQLEAFRPGLPVLFVSGYTEEDVVRRGLFEPGRPFLAKPFTPEAIAAKVGAIFRAHRPHPG
jgi:PAS domain S-box-containing protein